MATDVAGAQKSVGVYRLREVADNLLDNALGYAPNSSHVAVVLRREKAPTGSTVS